MTLEEIIAIADEAYGDGVVLQYFVDPDDADGDGLAAFIVSEIEETYDETLKDKDQLQEVMRVIDMAWADLARVANAFARRVEGRK